MSARAAEPAVAPGVARLSAIERGSVIVVRNDDKKTQVEGVANLPVFKGDEVAAIDPETQAELELDGYTAVRMAGGALVRIVQNDEAAREIQVVRGVVEVALLHSDAGHTSVLTPPATVRIDKPGNYRISVDTGSTTLTARRGEADLVTQQHTFSAKHGETLLVRGEAEKANVQYVDEVATDSFDDFNRNRDRASYAAMNANVNVPQDIASYDDLSRYGSWADVSPYGESWIPSNQSAGWAPYRDGNWVWGASYGWTWVGSEPWGWLPYHYGSWFFAPGYGWCWYPPSFAVAPVWVPAFVSFFGFGFDSFGYYGWVPLAPYENFYPWYPWSYGYYYPWPTYHPVPPLPPIPPPPPPHHHHATIPRMHPQLESAYRNAAFGGASTIEGLGAHPVRFDPAHAGEITLEKKPLAVPLPVFRAPAAHTLITPVQAVMQGMPSFSGTPVTHGTPSMHGMPSMHASPVSTSSLPPSLWEAHPAQPVTRVGAPTPVTHVGVPAMHADPPAREAPPATHGSSTPVMHDQPASRPPA